MRRIREEIRKAIAWQELKGSGPDILTLAPVLRGLFRPAGGCCLFHTNDLLQTRFLRAAEYEAFFTWSAACFPHRIALVAGLLEYNGDEAAAAAAAGVLFEAAPGLNLVAVPGLGIFSLGAGPAAARLRRDYLLDLLQLYLYEQSAKGPVAELADRGLEEHYAAALAAVVLPAGPLAGKVALVTGGARGFGRGLAEHLLAWGATVVLADLNGEQARQAARELEAACKPESAGGDVGRSDVSGRVLAVEADVGREEGVVRMVEEVVAGCGGIDILLSNAGVLRAGSLESLDLAAFELSTRINYTAFFLCTKYVSLVMKRQARYQPGYTADIIQINSKSGLEGSKRNFAYAGSKFGGLGLTQSFALELVEYGIKVNAVCPGNFFEGPLWSDPETGLFVQYLQAGKVPGARSVEDVRRFYESKVPMGRGCRVADVARAVLYIIEQEYETGQAVPVTGGQIMLK